MSSKYFKAFVFAGKSFLWAAALYLVCLVALYKDDIVTVASRTASFSLNIKAHTFLPRVNDTVIIPNIPHTGISLSPGIGIKTIQVSINGLSQLLHLFHSR